MKRRSKKLSISVGFGDDGATTRGEGKFFLPLFFKKRRPCLPAGRKWDERLGFSLRLLLMVLGVGLTAGRGEAASFEACPAEIFVTQTLSGGAGDFVVSDKGVAHRLETIEFSSGPPAQQAWLAPSFSNATHSTWNFSPRDRIFLSCEYGYTSLVLSRPIASDVRSCRVELDASFSPPLAIGVSCR